MGLLIENLLETVLASEGCFMSAARFRLRLSTFRLQNIQCTYMIDIEVILIALFLDFSKSLMN